MRQISLSSCPLTNFLLFLISTLCISSKCLPPPTWFCTFIPSMFLSLGISLWPPFLHWCSQLYIKSMTALAFHPTMTLGSSLPALWEHMSPSLAGFPPFHLPLPHFYKATNSKQGLINKKWLFVVNEFILSRPSRALSLFCLMIILSPLSPLKISSVFFIALKMWTEPKI